MSDPLGRFVDLDDVVLGVVDQVADYGGANKATTAGDENTHQDIFSRNAATDAVAASLSDKIAAVL